MAEESDSSVELVQRDTIQLYERKRWIKITFNGDTKRILDPPRDFELLTIAILQRFPVLKIVAEHPYRPQVVDLLHKKQPILNSYELLQVWKTCDEQKQVLHLRAVTSDKVVPMLLDAILQVAPDAPINNFDHIPDSYPQLGGPADLAEAVPRFDFNVGQAQQVPDLRQFSQPGQQFGAPNFEQQKPIFDQGIQQNNWNIPGGVRDNLFQPSPQNVCQNCQAVGHSSQNCPMYGNFLDAPPEQNDQQQVRAINVQKFVGISVKQIWSSKGLSMKTTIQGSSRSKRSKINGRCHQSKQNKNGSQQAMMNNQQSSMMQELMKYLSKVSFFKLNIAVDKGFLDSFISNFKGQPTQEQLYVLLGVVEAIKLPHADIIDKNSQYGVAELGRPLSFYFTITNHTQLPWDSDSQIVCDCALVAPQNQKYGLRLNKFEKATIRFDITLPLNFKQNKLQLNFFVEYDNNKKRIGEPIQILLEVQKVQGNPQSMNVQPPKKIISEGELYTLAAEMEDHSYGTFDQCFQVLTKCQGDIVKAKEIMLLSAEK